MNLGSLARTLMQKTVALAGDGAKEVIFTLLETVTYDPEDGEIVRDDDITNPIKALLGPVSEMEAAKFRLEKSTHKLVVASLDYEATGLDDPQTHDKLSIGGRVWLIERVIVGPFDESLWFYVCEA